MQLLRTIGFFHANIFLISATIGAGIFVSPKGVLQCSSLNIPVSLSIWAVCGLLSMMNALCQAELATTFPVSAAPYYFLKKALGPSIAFLSIWVKLFVYPLGLGVQSLLIASYLIEPFYAGCPAPELPKKCLALALLWSLGLLHARGVRTVAWFQTISSLMKMAVLCFICLTGVVLLVSGNKESVDRFKNALDAEVPYASQMAEAFLQVYYAYIGLAILTFVAGEIKRPGDTIPKALICGLSIITVIYLLANISYLAVLTPQEIISSDSVAVTWIERVCPSIKWVVSLGITISILETTSCAIFSGSRIFYSASQEGQLPVIYSMLNDHFCPVLAVTQIIILSSIVIITSNLMYLMKYVGIGSWFISLLNMVGLLKLRYQRPDLPRPYKVWTPLIFGSVASSLFLIFVPIIQTPSIEHIYQVMFIFIGLLYYWLQVHLNQHCVYFDTINCHLQLLFNVSTSEDQDKSIYEQKY